MQILQLRWSFGQVKLIVSLHHKSPQRVNDDLKTASIKMSFRLLTDPPIILQKLHIQTRPQLHSPPEMLNVRDPSGELCKSNGKTKKINHSVLQVEVNRRSAFICKCTDTMGSFGNVKLKSRFVIYFWFWINWSSR